MVKVLDLETTTDVRYLTGDNSDMINNPNSVFICAVMTGEVAETCDTINTAYGRENAEKFILNLEPDIYYTWNGARFDLHFLYHLFRRNGYRNQESHNSQNSKKRQLLVSEMTYLLAGSKIISLTIHTPQGLLEFFDACLLFSCNLATFIKNTCPEHPKLEGTYNYSKFRLTEDDFSPTDKKYCEADVKGFAIGLYRIQKDFENDFDMDILGSLTAGGFAMKFAKREMSKILDVSTDELVENFKTTSKFPREFISGGRTYVNPEHRGVIKKGISKIDSNSAYPASMVSKKHPIGNFIKMDVTAENLKQLLEENPDVYVFARLIRGQVLYNDKFSPILIKRDGQCLYPIHATDEDDVYLDDYVLRDPKFEMFGLFRIYLFQETTLTHPIFAYMREVYGLKNKYKKEGKKGLELAVKIILNSTFGKFLQREEIPTYDFMDGLIGRVKDAPVKKLDAWYIYPALGASITASVRYELTTYMNMLGSQFIYCDTDSLIYTGETPKGIPLGNELGEWKEEGTPTGITSYGVPVEKTGDFIAFQPKTYAIMLDDELKLTFCGISNNAIEKEFGKDSTVEDVKVKMQEGITFDVLRSYRTVNGVILMDKGIQKKENQFLSTTVDNLEEAVLQYEQIMYQQELKHNREEQ